MKTTERLALGKGYGDTHAVFLCEVCGIRYEQPFPAVYLDYYDIRDNYYTEVDVGDICPACLEAGPEGAAQRAREHAKRLREGADLLDELARDLPQCENWPPSRTWTPRRGRL